MFSRKTSDTLITLSLTEAAFILVFAVLLLLGSKLIFIAQSEQECKVELNACSQQRDVCESDVKACKSQLAKVTAKPDDIVTSLVNAEKLNLENQELKAKLDEAARKAAASKYLEDKKLPEPARMHAALELLEGFEKEKGLSIPGEVARKEGEEAARAAKDLQNCRGQLKNCTSKLGPRGYGLPPCWTDPPTGQIQYIYDVELRNDGVTAKAVWPAERQQDAQALQGALELPGYGVMRLEDFQARTQGIFQAGRKANPECRHYVKLYRSPALKDIDLFNRLRLGVEDYFYKLDLTKTGS